MEGSDTHKYTDITKPKIDLMFTELTRSGAKIAGSNPWLIETNHHGVVLAAEWNESSSTLAVTVTRSNWYVPRDKVWSSLDDMISNVQQLETA